MASSLQTLFTPIFIVIALGILIAGIVGIQLLDRLFAGSKNLNAIRMFAFTIIINIIILLFLIMSFSKIKFAPGAVGPQGNKGYRGLSGRDGGLKMCGMRYQTVEEKKSLEKASNYLDLKPPVIGDEDN